MPNARALRLAFATLFVVTLLAACATASTKSEGSKSGSRPKTDCKTCYRMCEVGGDASKSKAVDKCKADCDEKCK